QVDVVHQLVQKTAYFNIITPLLMQIYNQLLQRQLKSADVDRSNFDLTAHAPELDLYDPNPTLLNLSQQYQQLGSDAKTILSEDGYAGLKSPTIPAQFRENVEAFIQTFGHLSDSGNDFSVKTWHEQPDLILSLIINLQNTPESTQKKITRDELNISGLKRTIFDPIYHRARRYRINREAISSLYTYGYGIFRNIFLALAQSFVDKGIIGDQKDIFLLYIDEIRTIVDNPQDAIQHQEQIATRKQEMAQSKDIVLPETIIGDTVVPINTTAQKQLQGVPTSRGYYQGPARVVEGIQDFDKVQSGDVLVIPYSDVGWTPLFNKAGAVIAESGGILSHSSIVAREFNIPAVVSVPSACTLLRDTVVSVNGITGEISIVGGDS
ncbi:MAG: PEP-utilizing enzyme, partial [Chloroflexota bacterium]